MVQLPDNMYNKIISEHFDITDTETRKILLGVNEAGADQVLVSLASKLYDNIIEKVDDIDYGTIPNSKGDITKIDNYDKLMDCVDTMHKLLTEYKQDTTSVETIEKAIQNIKARKDVFEKGFRYDIEFIIVIYSTMVLAVISSTSLMIASSIEFIKSPNNDDFKLAVNKVTTTNTKDNLLFSNLVKFNNICSNGKLDKSLEHIIKSGTNQLTGVDDIAIVSAIAIGSIIVLIIPMIRELIFFFFNTRTRVSDYFEIQADLLQMNAYNVENNELMKKSERANISKKQLGIVDKFRKISNFLSIDKKKADTTARKEIAQDDKKYKANELLDSAPDSATSSSLF